MTKRWQIFTVLALMFVVGFFYRVSIAVVSGDLTRELGLTAAQLGVMSAIYFYVFAFVQIPLGPLLDRFGGRLIISVLGVVTTCGSLIFALAPDYPAILAGRGLLGLGTACVLMGSLKIFTNWFSVREFPRISGFMIAAGYVGGITATSPLAFAIGLFSWRPTFIAMSVIQALITISVFLIARDTPTDSEKATVPAQEQSDEPKIGVLTIWKTLFSSIDFWLISLIAFFWYGNFMVLLALWGGPYLTDVIGMDRSQVGNILLCTSVGYICGALLIGKAIDRFGGSLEKTILCGQILLLAGMTTMLGPLEHLPGALMAVVFFAIGLVSASGLIIYPLARKQAPPRSAATAMTCVNSFLFMGAATMQHVMGYYIYSFPRTPTGYPSSAYHGAFLIPICGLASVLVLFSLRKVLRGFDARESA